MTSLLMNTETVSNLSTRLRQTARLLMESSASLQQNVTYMPWESNTRDQYVSEIGEVIRRLRVEAEKLNALADLTQREVNQWIETDAHLGGAVVAGLCGNFLGFSSVGGNGLSMTTLPIAGGGWALSGQLSQLNVPAFFSRLSGDLAHPNLPPWLENLLGLGKKGSGGDIPNPAGSESTAAVDTSTPAATETTSPHPKGDGFGALLRAEEERAAAVKAAEAAKAAEANKPPFYDVPPLAQGKIYGNAACLPTSISMVLNYFHSKDPNVPTITTQTLVDMSDPSDGTEGNGFTIDRLNDELAEIGVPNTGTKMHADLETLKTQLKDGPVIVATGVYISGQGDNRQLHGPGSTIHAIVVKGFSADGQTAYINDPWSGKAMEFPLDKFEKMWGKGSNTTLTIRP